MAPDFISRLISEEVAEGGCLKWSVQVTGDPTPKIVWLRDGQEIPNCEEVQLLDVSDSERSNQKSKTCLKFKAIDVPFFSNKNELVL